MLKRIITIHLAVLLFASASVFSQNLSLNLASDYEMIINGSANIQDWDASITRIEAEFVLNGFDGETFENLKPEHFNTLRLRIPVESIDGDGRRLTRNIHDYLRKDEHPQITFELTSVNDIEASRDSGLIYATGIITAAGSSHTIDMEVSVKKEGNGSLVFSGSQDLLMSDFGIDPPTVVFGTIRARDEMTISYRVRFTN